MKTDLIAEAARRQVDAGAFASIEWMVVRDGSEWSRGAIGMADPLNGIALPEKPIYRIYSMTKPVISAIAMMLVCEGKLHLGDLAGSYIPGLLRPRIMDEDGKTRRARQPLTVAHLLSHTSGLSYGFLPGCPVAKLYREAQLRHASESLAEMVDRLAAFPIAFEPGSQWRYSVATDVVARIIEIIEEKPLSDIMRERVLAPLGLLDTGFMVREEARSRLMPMFGNANIDELMVVPKGPQQLVPCDVEDSYPASDPSFARGGYGLFSTLDDYAVIASFLATGKAPSGEELLPRKAVELMWTNRIPASQRPISIDTIKLHGYGFALAGRVMVEPGQALVLNSAGEFGWSGAASTWFFIDPAERMTGIVMSQYLGSKIRLADDMQNAIYASISD